ncbi:MAG TPA: SIMPL domain-containing protein [Gemmatimonadaceae bacterium]
MPIIVIAALLALMAPHAHAQDTTQRAGDPPSIVATGEGRREVPPDRVTIVLAVQTRASTPLQAATENNERMTVVLRALRQAGLDSSEISTAHYTVHPQTWRNENDTVYVASNAVRVETGKLDQLAQVIGAALDAGATTVSALEFGLADPSAATRDALGDAVRNARLQAEALAAAAGGTLGDLEHLSTQPVGFVPVYAQRDMAMMSMQGGAPPITPGQVTVTATVTARWRFVPNR